MKKMHVMRSVFEAAIEMLLIPRSERAYTRQPGEGVDRANRDLINHRKKFDGIDKTPTATRQGQRAFDRMTAKMIRSAKKREAMQQKRPGGAGAVV